MITLDHMKINDVVKMAESRMRSGIYNSTYHPDYAIDMNKLEIIVNVSDGIFKIDKNGLFLNDTQLTEEDILVDRLKNTYHAWERMTQFQRILKTIHQVRLYNTTSERL